MEIKFKKDSKPPKGVTPVKLKSEVESILLHYTNGSKQLQIGIPKKINRRKFILVIREIIKTAKLNKIKKIAISFADFSIAKLKIPQQELAKLITTNLVIANFEFVAYKTPPAGGWNFVEEVIIYNKTVSKEIKTGLEKGQIIGEEINNSRILTNTPGKDMHPEQMATHVKEIFKGTQVKVKVLKEKELAKLGAGGILGVSQGSHFAPHFIIMEYNGGGKEKPIALVGKAVTYDTGGLCLKPTLGLLDMHMDMAGGAVVIHTLAIASKLKLKKNVIGIVPAVENSVSTSSFRPGDILKMMSGLHVEVLNTDAEGRLILADALTYAKRYKPRLVIDIATLTGASRVALGLRATAILSNDDETIKLTQELGEKCGDYVWPLPLWEEYESEIKGNFGDICNIQSNAVYRYGGAIIAATFLHQFAREYRWLHMDIATRMTSIEGDHLAKGATGEPMRLLTQLIENA